MRGRNYSGVFIKVTKFIKIKISSETSSEEAHSHKENRIYSEIHFSRNMAVNERKTFGYYASHICKELIHQLTNVNVSVLKSSK